MKIHLFFILCYSYALFVYRALFFVVHGYCEHCLYYTELAHILKEEGFYVFSHDHGELKDFIAS